MKLDDEQFALIMNDQLPEAFWEFQLGVGYIYYDAPENLRYSQPYLEYGRAFWSKVKLSVYHALCSNGKPKEALEEYIEGDVRNLAEAILSILLATFEITLAVAIPIVALILKKGIKSFCSKNITFEEIQLKMKEILESKSIRLDLDQEE